MLKNRYSAFIPGSSPIERILRGMGIDTILIAGTKTNVCCKSTARDAMMLDFKVIMVEDCCAALSDDEHRSALENIIQQFGDVMTASEVLVRLRFRENERAVTDGARLTAGKTAEPGSGGRPGRFKI